MGFAYSPQVVELRSRLQNFMDDHIVPRIRAYNEEVNGLSPMPPIQTARFSS